VTPRKYSEFEGTREEERDKINEQLLTYFKEGKKIKDYAEVFSEMRNFFSFNLAPFLFNESISTKFAVNLQLYYKTIDNLGTEKHAPWKKRCESGEDIGCFALTELAHGSNVKGIQTTAHYDKETQEFVINTPQERDMKFWIGGAAKTSNVSVVFAQLIMDGKSEGPHAFLVPLRNKKNHMPLPGITLGDCGKKIGLDGIDNGFIIFRNVRIPRHNLLDHLSQVTPEGQFVTDIPNADQRFAISLGGLSSGRILIARASPTNLGYGLKIAIRFAAMRQ